MLFSFNTITSIRRGKSNKVPAKKYQGRGRVDERLDVNKIDHKLNLMYCDLKRGGDSFGITPSPPPGMVI